jgi:hypothetical protein
MNAELRLGWEQQVKLRAHLVMRRANGKGYRTLCSQTRALMTTQSAKLDKAPANACLKCLELSGERAEPNPCDPSHINDQEDRKG